ncbi:uncharacterized protein LOC143180203 [Calliopsis andreniformis]|uniref:uncharacterized protein LOC143180203 n=1 Tax=Calliopsis andreniformis TaxID=337506 RepID=UPI003FCDCAAA
MTLNVGRSSCIHIITLKYTERPFNERGCSRTDRQVDFQFLAGEWTEELFTIVTEPTYSTDSARELSEKLSELTNHLSDSDDADAEIVVNATREAFTISQRENTKEIWKILKVSSIRIK